LNQVSHEYTANGLLSTVEFFLHEFHVFRVHACADEFSAQFHFRDVLLMLLPSLHPPDERAERVMYFPVPCHVPDEPDDDDEDDEPESQAPGG
jgi:hypothetical protein